MTTLADILRTGTVPEAVRFVQDQVRGAPGRVDLRTQLFQLYCVAGEWGRAETQLDLMGDLESADGELAMAAPAFRSLVNAERTRLDVVGGRVKPLILGEPEPALASQIEGVKQLAAGQAAAAIQLFIEARSLGSCVTGKIDEVAFAWIADADARFGFAAEVILGGTYYWIPFTRISRIEFQPVSAVHDQVWRECSITLSSGAAVQGYMPLRYPEAAATGDRELQTGRAAAWQEIGENFFVGTGARCWATDLADYPARTIQVAEFNTAAG